MSKKSIFDFNDNDDGINLDMTPLIDVIFMLIIFFVLTTTFLKPLVSVDLPSSDTASVSRDNEMITIVVTDDGIYMYDGKQVTVTEIKEILASNPYKDLNIFADKNVPFQYFVSLLDIAKELKAGHFVISTERNVVEYENN